MAALSLWTLLYLILNNIQGIKKTVQILRTFYILPEFRSSKWHFTFILKFWDTYQNLKFSFSYLAYIFKRGVEGGKIFGGAFTPTLGAPHVTTFVATPNCWSLNRANLYYPGSTPNYLSSPVKKRIKVGRDFRAIQNLLHAPG